MSAFFYAKDQYGRDISLRKRENLSTKDEFGRDVELRKVIPRVASHKVDDYAQFIESISAKLKVMTWAEYDYELCEIEEAQKKKQEKEAQAKNKALDAIRANLAKDGLYELEEGEIL
jgi:hypothetical protein